MTAKRKPPAKRKKTPAKREVAKKPVGRPTAFTQAKADQICALLASGLSVREMMRKFPSLPGRTSLHRWLADDRYAQFRDQYARAREEGCEHILEGIRDIGVGGDFDELFSEPILNKEGQVVGVKYDAARARVASDNQKWFLEKINPKKYGKQITQTHEVGDSLEHLAVQEVDKIIEAALAGES